MPTRSRRSRRSRKSRKILPRPTKGALRGYSTHLSAASRRRILEEDIRRRGYATTIRELNLIATFTKRTSPTAHNKIEADMAYLKREYRS